MVSCLRDDDVRLTASSVRGAFWMLTAMISAYVPDSSVAEIFRSAKDGRSSFRYVPGVSVWNLGALYVYVVIVYMSLYLIKYRRGFS